MTNKKKATVKKKAWIPKKDFKEHKKIILDGLINGQSLRAICRDDGIPKRATIFRLCKDDAEFCNQYALAYEFQADYYAEMIIDKTQSLLDRSIAGEAQPHEVAATSIYVDTRKWIAVRQAPKKYGKQAAISTENGEIKIIDALVPTR